MTPQTPYQILGVSRDADMPTVKRAWHALCLLHHPDKIGQTAAAHENFVRIQGAYESICKERGEQNIPDNKPDKDHPAGKSENEYQAEDKGDILFMSHSKATDQIHMIDWHLHILIGRLHTFFTRYIIVCPHSEKLTWDELERCSKSLHAASKEANNIIYQIFDIPRASWKQDNEETRTMLATISRLEVKCKQMKQIQSQLEAIARVADDATEEERRALKLLLRSEAAKWP